ncbi:MAG: restriction endonuclease subunit S [Endomicrobium sp.]|jgi:type I restriction enzyme M protein|nr:restriction endonuclease subunit S [Endomicrobium sp.]
MIAFDRKEFEKLININIRKNIIQKSKYQTDLLENIVDFQSGLWKGYTDDLQLVKVLRNTNFDNGKLSYKNIAEIDVDKEQFKKRQLKYGDIILEKSGGSETQAIGRVALFDKNTEEIYSYSNFCLRIRVKEENKVNPIYLWLFLNDFYNNGGTKPLQNGVRLLNIDLEGYKKINIPLPPKG